MELLHRKRGEQDQRQPPTTRANSSNLYPSFTAGPSNFVASNTAPKISPTTHMSTESYPPYNSGQHNIPIFPEATSMSLPESSAFDPVTLGPNSSGIYSFTPPSTGSFPPVTEPQTSSLFGWWSGNEAWREYAQSISTMAGELDPTETYSASALIALNRDCDSSMHPNLHNGTPNTANIVSATGNSGTPISAARNNSYPPPETTGGSWPVMTGNYGYADNSALRGVSGGDTGGNGP